MERHCEEVADVELHEVRGHDRREPARDASGDPVADRPPHALADGAAQPLTEPPLRFAHGSTATGQEQNHDHRQGPIRLPPHDRLSCFGSEASSDAPGSEAPPEHIADRPTRASSGGSRPDRPDGEAEDVRTAAPNAMALRVGAAAPHAMVAGCGGDALWCLVGARRLMGARRLRVSRGSAAPYSSRGRRPGKALASGEKEVLRCRAERGFRRRAKQALRTSEETAPGRRTRSIPSGRTPYLPTIGLRSASAAAIPRRPANPDRACGFTAGVASPSSSGRRSCASSTAPGVTGRWPRVHEVCGTTRSFLRLLTHPYADRGSRRRQLATAGPGPGSPRVSS